MNYKKLNVEDEVNSVVSAIKKGDCRSATKRESMAVRLAALSEIVREMQTIIKNDKEYHSAKSLNDSPPRI